MSETPNLYQQTVQINAVPEVVFEFFTNAEKMARWLGTANRVDPTPGGELDVDMDCNDIAKGTYLVIEHPKRVVFTWGWQGSDIMPPGSSTVEVTLEPNGEGTLLEFTHRDCPESELESHATGWKLHLGQLEETVALTARTSE